MNNSFAWGQILNPLDVLFFRIDGVFLNEKNTFLVLVVASIRLSRALKKRKINFRKFLYSTKRKEGTFNFHD